MATLLRYLEPVRAGAPTPRKDAAPLDCGRIGAEAREAAALWAARPLRERLRAVRALRHRSAARARDLVRAVRRGGERTEAEVLSSEVIPLLDAFRFLEREAAHLLSPRRLASEGRPFWLSGVEAEVRREPLGVVLVVAPSNYPLFLPGVQAVQALAAGNAVLWKPGRGGLPAARALAGLAVEAGIDPRLLTVLPEEAARAALAAGVDKVLLTGSAATGRAVLAELAGRLVPATVELSGCDASFVLPGADLERVARAVGFGLALNAGATCIAPRRVFVPRPVAGGLAARIGELAAALPAVAVDPETAGRARALAAGAVEGGARLLAGSLEPADGFQPLVVAEALPAMRLLQEDLFAPVVSLVSVGDVEEALADDALCPYALGVSIFGPEREARALAGRVRAGVVVINDVIVPTADPRLPFGGRGESGFGVTRGAEGLLDLTAPKVVAVRRGRRLPHLEERHPEDAALFHAYLTLTHGGGARARLRGAAGLLRALVRRGRRGRGV